MVVPFTMMRNTERGLVYREVQPWPGWVYCNTGTSKERGSVDSWGEGRLEREGGHQHSDASCSHGRGCDHQEGDYSAKSRTQQILNEESKEERAERQKERWCQGSRVEQFQKQGMNSQCQKQLSQGRQGWENVANWRVNGRLEVWVKRRLRGWMAAGKDRGTKQSSYL